MRRRIPGCFHAGDLRVSSENGTTSATGFPRLRRIIVSPCSTSVMKSEALLRKSVNATLFIYAPPDVCIQLYILDGILSRFNYFEANVEGLLIVNPPRVHDKQHPLVSPSEFRIPSSVSRLLSLSAALRSHRFCQ